MVEKKPWYQSLTIKGSVVSFVAVAVLVARAFGYDIGPDLEKEIVAAVLAVAATAGTVMQVIGRLRAKTRIGR